MGNGRFTIPFGLKIWVAAAGLAIAGASAEAADITTEEKALFGETITFITIDGPIAPGDHERFAEAAAGAALAVVRLNGHGGDLMAAIEIGSLIRLNGYLTLVDWGATCTGGCALAWLGGTTLFMGHDRQVGLQSRGSTEDPLRPGFAYASLVGAYAAHLGYPTEAVAYVMTAPTHEVRWLSFAEAGRHGIAVVGAVGPDKAKEPEMPVEEEREEPEEPELEISR